PERVGYARPWRSFFLTTAVVSRADAGHMRKRSLREIRRIEYGIAVPDTSRYTFHETNHQIYDYLNLVAALGANSQPVPTHLAVTQGEIKSAAQKFNLTT